MGRKSTFDEDLAHSIIERMSDGEAVSQICKPANMPAPSTVRLWAINNEGGWFADSYARARVSQGEAEADLLRNVMQDLADGKIDFQTARVLMDGHKWRASHLAVRVWGDKIEHSGQINVGLAAELAEARKRKLGAGTPELE